MLDYYLKKKKAAGMREGMSIKKERLGLRLGKTMFIHS